MFKVLRSIIEIVNSDKKTKITRLVYVIEIEYNCRTLISYFSCVIVVMVYVKYLVKKITYLSLKVFSEL